MRRYRLRVVLIALSAGSFFAGDAWAGVGLSQAGVTSSTPSKTATNSTPPHKVLPLSLKKLAIPAGSVVCGIDSIFYNGFESATFTLAANWDGAMVSPGLTQDITATLASVSINLPAVASTGDPTVDVAGTFVGPANTGISVNGVAGATANGKFLVPSVPLKAGPNSLSVIATSLTGVTVTTSTNITQSGSPSPTAMLSDNPYGYAPFIVNFTYKVGTLPSNYPVQSVAVNFKGSGADDYTGTLAGAPSRYVYTQPGLYTAQFRVTDTSNNTYIAYRSVLIQDFNAQRGMLCDVYGYLLDRLNAQDAVNAANAFQTVVRSSYKSFFSQLGTHMPAVAQQLGVVIDGQLGTGIAELLLERDNPDQTRSGFPLRMTQGTDGVWRISEM